MAEDGDHPARQLLLDRQVEQVRALVREILPANPFYRKKFEQVGLSAESIRTLDDFRKLPFTTKEELARAQELHPPYGQLWTYPLGEYSRLHQTSGTLGRPLRWLDTPKSWNWMLGCWDDMFRVIGLGKDDRLFFPFSFGPFLGFWTAFDAASRAGFLCLPGGGMSTVARLRFMLDNEATVVFCTPTYALRLAEVAEEEGIDLAGSPVRAVVVAGEPGGSIPATRVRVENAWKARVFDHSGMTEVGPAAIECRENPVGLHLLEKHYLAEVIDLNSEQQAETGTLGELVLSNLGRTGSPVLRYRTGDLVRVDPEPCPCGRSELRLRGGILGRADDMIYLRGNNLYPSALEAVIRRFPEVAEYQVEVKQSGPLAELRITVEPTAAAVHSPIAAQVARAIRDELLFRAEVSAVPPGTLPRYEMKARRVKIT